MLLATLNIGVLLPVNSENIFAQKNNTAENIDSSLITTAEIDEGLDNNTSTQLTNNTSAIE
jgi:hypothetical protein